MMMPDCGPPSSLSPLKQHTSTPASIEVSTAGSRRSSGWPARPERLSCGTREMTAAEILCHRHPQAPAERDQLVEIRPLCKPLDPEVRRVDAQNQCRPVADRSGIVGHARLVRRAHFAQHRARLRHDVGDAEPATDFDQLASRDHDLPAGCERGQNEHGGRGVVVHDDGGFRAGEAAEQRFGVDVAPASLAAGDVILERGVSAGDFRHAIDRRGRERRAAQIRVDDHPGGVDDRLQRRPKHIPEARGGECFDPGDDHAGIADRRPRGSDGLSSGGRARAQGVDGRV